MQNLNTELATTALEMSPVGVLVFDKENIIQWTNPSMCEFLGAPSAEIINLSFMDLTTRYLDGFSDHPDLWKVSNVVDRQTRWLVAIDNPKTDSNGNTIRYFSDVSEIMKLKTECRNLKDQLDNVSTADTLTGLLNKRSLMQALEPQVSRSRRYNNPLSIIVMQIENFKAHAKNVTPVTDQVLTSVSFYLRDQMRWVDLVGRTGDSEFTLILPETSEEDAKKLASKIESRLQNLSLPDSPEVMISVDAKYGVAAWEKGDDTSMLLKRVNEDMSESSSNVAVG